jgi:hypothetical protein
MKKGILVPLIVAYIILISSCTPRLNPPKIQLSINSFDLGNINPDQGVREEIFLVKNEGGQPLDIVSVSTSCGCTEAEVESEEILPGEQTKLSVTYDPSVHPELTGKIKRVVYIKSNDPIQEEVELELTGNILKRGNINE